MQLMALLKELICGSYSGSLQANVHSESRDLLDRTEQSKTSKIAALLGEIYEYSDRRMYGNWNGWVHRHHYRAHPCNRVLLASPKLYSWQSLAGKPASVSIPFTRRAQPELAPEKIIC